MENSELVNIKNQILKLSPDKWWGDDFDVRFYLISKLKEIHNKKILDIGGGIGIILSKMDDSNHKINLDVSFEDLKISNKIDKKIQCVCGSITNLPFKENSLDCIIVANVLEITKELDLKLKNNQNSISKNFLSQIKNIRKKDSIVFITTPNNAYYNTKKLTFNELENLLNQFFNNFRIYFFNTYPKLSNYSRKLNLANVIPKIRAKITNEHSLLDSLCKSNSKNNYSVSFFVKIND